VDASALPKPLYISAIPDNSLLVAVAEVRHDGTTPSPDGMSLVMHQILVPRVFPSSPFTIDKRKDIPSDHSTLKDGRLITGILQESPTDASRIQVSIHAEIVNVVFRTFTNGRTGKDQYEITLPLADRSTADNEFQMEQGKWTCFSSSSVSSPKSTTGTSEKLPADHSLILFIRIDRSPTAPPIQQLRPNDSQPASQTTPDEQRFSIEINKPASTVMTWFTRRIAPRTVTLAPELNETLININLHDVTPDEALHKICDQEGWTLTQDASGYHIAPKSVPAKPQPNF
jgi:hypothetical protein